MFFQPGKNCWTVAHADEMAVLIDAENYFRAFLSVLRQARYSVLILAWDIHTHVVLDPKDSTKTGTAITLESALIEALKEQSDLNVYILCWDFAMIYALERQVLPQFRRAFRHPRIHFVLDSFHPFGASQHQKIVVIDDQLAFIGGLDLCLRRWDTRSHRAFDPQRVDHHHEQYRPFHDVQAVLNGDAASAISSLAKDRWWRATGQQLPSLKTARKIWPKGVLPDFKNVSVAVSRTYFSIEGKKKIREIERLFLDSIEAAERFVYVENQYFTSDVIKEAVLKKISDPKGPEFLFLLPRFNSGWVEERSMGVFRTRLIRELMAKDTYRKLRFYYPAVQEKKLYPISLHSKLMIVDNRILHLGSANLNNRSMGLDTECDIALVSDEGVEDSEQISKKIGILRGSLLSEHLGVEIEQIENITSETGSLFAVLDRVPETLKSNRVLLPFPTDLKRVVDQWTPDTMMLDPDHPIEDDPFLSRFMPKNKPTFRRLKNLKIKIRLVTVTILSLLLMVPRLREVLGVFKGYLWTQSICQDFNPLVLTFLITLFGSLFRLPMDVLVFTMAFTLSSFADLAWLYILFGIMSVAVLAYLTGSVAGKVLQDERFKLEIKRPRKKSEFWAHLLLHWNLVAPFISVCFQAGKISTPFFIFFAGTLIGQLFRVLLVCIYATLFAHLITEASLLGLAAFLMVSVVILVVSSWSNQRFLPSYGGRKAD